MNRESTIPVRVRIDSPAMLLLHRSTRWVDVHAPKVADRFLTTILALGLCLACSGCIFMQVREDQELIAGFVDVEVRIAVIDWSGSPLIFAAGRLPDEPGSKLMVISHRRTLKDPNRISIKLAPGRYVLAAFEDLDANGRHDRGERGLVSSEFEVVLGKSLPERPLVISKTYERGRLAKYEKLESRNYSVGEVVGLDDERFSEKFAAMGLWTPGRYILERRIGLYMLEDYDSERTPVLFIHGMSGYPQEFTKLIDNLDTARFQPWVYLYPSGYGLTEIATFLNDLVVELEVKHEFTNLCVVAHSMGGLVARDFLGLFGDTSQRHSVRTFITLASPLAGMPSAGLGVKMAPEVVPSWYDLAPGSDYQQRIYRTALDEQIEYHLIFAYDELGASDGTVPLLSQLRDEAQGEAAVVRGFSATHRGVLESVAVQAQVYTALDRCRGDVDAPLVAPRVLGEGSGGVN